MSKELQQNVLPRLKVGDQTALKQLFDTYYPSLCNTVFRMMNDRPTAEDVIQNVFIKLWEKRAQLEINTSVGAYLRRFAINEAISHMRKHKKFVSEPIEMGMPLQSAYQGAEEQLLENEVQQQVANAINELPPRCQAIFKLSRYEELSYKEIASQLDISVKTVENQMGKALKVLRLSLKNLLTLLILIISSIF